MSLAYSLVNPKEVSNALKELQDFENPHEIKSPRKIPAIEYRADEPQAQNLLPIQAAVQPNQLPENEQNEPSMDFDILDMISGIDENQMLLAASQMEEKLAMTTTVTTTKETTTMFRSNQDQHPSPFQNCRIGSIGTININIYKK